MFNETQSGVFYALGACMAWGLVFAIPLFMDQLNPFEVSLSRYFFFGLIATIILLGSKRYLFKAISIKVWGQIFFLALISNITHYTALIFGIRYTSPTVATLILSLSPIAITLYAIWTSSSRKIKVPKLSLLTIALGLILVNIPLLKVEVQSTDLSLRYFFGLCCAFLALVTWTWYMIANANFLLQNPQIPPMDWVIAVGFATFILVGMESLIIFSLYEENFLNREFTSSGVNQFFWGGLVLGVISSWVATYLWNHSLTRLPIAIVGQFTLFETIFGLFFVFMIDQRWPMPLEFLGILFMLIGVFFSYKIIKNEYTVFSKSSF